MEFRHTRAYMNLNSVTRLSSQYHGRFTVSVWNGLPLGISCGEGTVYIFLLLLMA